MSQLVKFTVAIAMLAGEGNAHLLSSDTRAEADDGETLRLVVEVCRHGERAPKEIFPIAENPEDNFEIPYNLTMTGAEHHYALG